MYRLIIFLFILLLHSSIFAGIFGESQDKNLETLEEEFGLSEEDAEEDSSPIISEKNSAEDRLEKEQSKAIENQKKTNESRQKQTGFYLKKAQFVALNKVTSKSEKISIKVGESTFFGNLEISAIKCFKSSELYNPIDKILIKAIEHKTDSDPETIFQGWLFSSNLSLSSITHPVYEIIAISCVE